MPKFRMKGDDLIYEHKLSLTEALYGFQFILTHLDDRQLFIKSKLRQVVKPGKPVALSPAPKIYLVLSQSEFFFAATDQYKIINDLLPIY